MTEEEFKQLRKDVDALIVKSTVINEDTKEDYRKASAYIRSRRTEILTPPKPVFPDELWKYAPDWADYVAMDEDRYWHWYANAPEESHDDWFLGGDSWESLGLKIPIPDGYDWRDSLHKRPVSSGTNEKECE